MKITPTNFYQVTPINHPPKAPAKNNAANTPLVKISAKAKLLAKSEQKDKDCAKIAQIKAQISNKTYQIDAQKIAGKMLQDLI